MIVHHILLLILLQVIIKVIATSTRPVVHTKLGAINGIEASDGDYNMYMAVPYGKVNLSNPFGDAIPINKYDTIIEADKESLSCIRVGNILFGKTDIKGKLDCLELNIYVPKVATETHLVPVMVYIYGGNFVAGSASRSSYGPRFLVRNNITLVTVDYRNGPYGFLCLDTPEVPGNQALKDQLLALKWVKENIKAFGGDPNKVTLAGHSSGSALVHYHYIYGPDNLFNKVILGSGSAYSEMAFERANRTVLFKLAEAAGFKTDSVSKAFDFVKNLDPRIVVRISNDLDFQNKPCVETIFDNLTNFITEYPFFASKNRKNMPMLLGNTNNETKFMYEKTNKTTFIEMMIGKGFNFDNYTLSETKEVIKSFYGEQDCDENDFLQTIQYFGSDFLFLHPNIRIIKEGLENNGKIYWFLFKYYGERDFMKKKKHKTVNASVHGDELGYLFDIDLFAADQHPITVRDQLMIDRFTTIWANFVKYGDPTPQKTSLLPVSWKPVNKDTIYCMVLDTEISLIKRPFHARMAFWELFYDIHLKNKVGSRDKDEK